MKYWKINAIILILCLSLCFCEKKIDSINKIKFERIVKNKVKNIYKTNDKLLNKLEDKNIVIKNNGHHNFIEKSSESSKMKLPNQQKLNKAKNALKFLHLKNPNIPDNQKDLIDYKECKYKTGFIEIVKRYNNSTVELETIRIELDVNKLRLFTALTKVSMFYSIELHKILRISQEEHFFNTVCFDIIRNEIKAQSLLVGSVTLCAKDKKDMDEWIQAIQQFKQCNDKTNNKSAKVMVDFNKINAIAKNGPNNLQNLFYENTHKVSNKDSSNNTKTKVIHKAVKNILETLKEDKIKENQLKRILENKKKQTQIFTKQLEKKNEIFDKMINDKLEKQQKMESKLNVENNQVQLIKAIAEKFKDLKTKQLNGMKNKIEREIRQEKIKAKDKADVLMNKLIKLNKNIKSDRCIDGKLKDFKDNNYIFNTCRAIYGKLGVETCMKKENFCALCCTHHYGENFIKERQECKSSCSLIINETQHQNNLKYNNLQ